MFFRRMFGRKGDQRRDDAENDSEDDSDGLAAGVDLSPDGQDKNNNSGFQAMHRKRNEFRNMGGSTAPTTTTRYSTSASTLHRAATSGSGSVVQLTPLWEHILRTRKLPDSICPVKMFAEFLERLRDPEWQVRQHALRVLVDVLVVMRSKADAYMDALVQQLVENLGHQAPTVRKGALDCLRVYLAETAMPETILLQVLDMGLNQKIANEPFGGRLTCGVMLSLPALVQATLHTPKRHFILRSTLDMLIQKMGQVTHQEITLKVLSKIRDLIGEHEFIDFMSHAAYREFQLLCNVYGVGLKTSGQTRNAGFGDSYEVKGGAWHVQNYTTYHAEDNCWRSSEEEQMLERTEAEPAKVIMETEIKINDDTLTMRILEATDSSAMDNSVKDNDNDDTEGGGGRHSRGDDIVCGRLNSGGGVIHLLSESEDGENDDVRTGRNTSNSNFSTVVTPSTPSRTPKRVTFGGEVVKVRTPDSDATSSNNNNSNNTKPTSTLQSLIAENESFAQIPSDSSGDSPPAVTIINDSPESKTTALRLDIPDDNTKPAEAHDNLPQSSSPNSFVSTQTTTAMPQSSSEEWHHSTPEIKKSSQSVEKSGDPASPLSPRSPFKRISVSPVDSIVSPRAPHKEIEVLHNLQRDPSPVRAKSARRNSLNSGVTREVQAEVEKKPLGGNKQEQDQSLSPLPPKSWEDLGLVDYHTLLDLRSGDWRHRLKGIIQVAEALRSSENLAIIQPCLASLLRTLLSSERNSGVAEEKHQLVMNLISRLPLDNLEDRTTQILSGLCRQGGAGANRVCKTLMQRLPPASIVLKLLSSDFMHAKSSRFREHALQMVMYALSTFPSTVFDMETCVTNATSAAFNRKRRVRQAALDVLAILGQIASPKTVLQVAEVITQSHENGDDLMTALRTRLSRKSVPLVASNGLVNYAFHIPSPRSGIIDDDFNDNASPFGADIEWINAGVGSVTPSAMQKRASLNRNCAKSSFQYLPHDQLETDGLKGQPDTSIEKSRNSGDQYGSRERNFLSGKEAFGVANNDHQVKSMQLLLNNSIPLPFSYGSGLKRPNVDYSHYMNSRLVSKSCSDSSVDGRSSDSTYTSSSGSGNTVGIATTVSESNGISGRFTRQTVNSRFPSMDRMDVMHMHMRIHKPPMYQPGMGAYAQLQQQQINMSSTFTKQQHNSHFGVQPGVRKKHHAAQIQQQLRPKPLTGSHQLNEIYLEAESRARGQQNSTNLDDTFTIQSGTMNTQYDDVTTSANGHHSTERRFINVEKFKIHKHQPTTSVDPNNSNTHHTPTSAQSLTYSQKSTNSVQSTSSRMNPTDSPNVDSSASNLLPNPGRGDEIDAKSTPIKWVTGEEVLQLMEYKAEFGDASSSTVEEELEVKDADQQSLRRNESIVSLPSKTESIKTVLGDTPPPMSRSQSAKSLVIEELIDGDDNDAGNDNEMGLKNGKNASFMIVEEIVKKAVEAIVDKTPDVVGEGDESGLNSVDKEPSRSTHGSAAKERGRAEQNLPITNPFSIPRSRSPTIEEIKAFSRRNSLVKSMESLYDRPPASKADSSLDNTTETSSQSSSQVNTAISAHPHHTPLKQKAKTTHFLKRNRRVSPIKQPIKIQATQVFAQSAERFDRPREALQATLNQLDSSNWQVNMEALESIVRLIRHHPDTLEAQMHMVCIQMTRTTRNLRSQVARAACNATRELFSTISPKVLEQECDDLVAALLHRTADTNRFLRGDATMALESMTDHLSLTKIINLLISKGMAHQNGLVRTTVAKLLHRVVERLGIEKVFTMVKENRDKIIITGANLLLEGSLETRSYAKSMFKILSDHPNYNRTLIEVIPVRTYRNVEKTLKNIQQL